MSHPAGHWETLHACEDAKAQGNSTAQCGGYHFSTCPDGTDAAAWEQFVGNDGTVSDGHPYCPTTAQTPQVTAGIVATAFKRLPLPASPLKIQPPGGETLVNFDTIFYTTNSHPFARVIPNLLGHRIVFWIRPAEYDWHWGDGAPYHESTDPGAPFTTQEAIAHDITHRYLRRGTFYPHLDTVYTANYKLDNGPWVPVPGSVTIEGDGVRLITRTAHPVLLDDTPADPNRGH